MLYDSAQEQLGDAYARAVQITSANGVEELVLNDSVTCKPHVLILAQLDLIKGYSLHQYRNPIIPSLPWIFYVP